MLDGRHTGTGGGNHVVLGGPTPADSPFLRRPDLLRSLVALLAQPSVAVVPVLRPVHRPDEPGAARRRSAGRRGLRTRNRASADCPTAPSCAAVARRPRLPPSARRRHRQHASRRVLHRQAVLARQRAPGRLGLVELRAFEMPPHARMSLTQQLLLRALLAAVLASAVRRAAGALGHRAARPLPAAALRRAGLRRRARGSARSAAIRFEPDWFAPHFEFRFPRCGARRAARRRARAAAGDRAVARARRRAGGGGTVALRRFVGRAPAGEGARADRRRGTSSPATAGACRCIRPGRPASSWPACATAPGSRRAVCTRRSPVHAPLVFDLLDRLERARDRRLHLSCRASRRAQLRDVPGERLRGRKPAAGAVLRSAIRPEPRRLHPKNGTRTFRSRSTCGALPVTEWSRACSAPSEMQPSATQPPGSTTPWRFLDDYRPDAKVFDEMLGANGAVGRTATGSSARSRGSAGTSSSRAGRTPSAPSATTASPTTSTAIRRASTARGRST